MKPDTLRVDIRQLLYNFEGKIVFEQGVEAVMIGDLIDGNLLILEPPSPIDHPRTHTSRIPLKERRIANLTEKIEFEITHKAEWRYHSVCWATWLCGAATSSLSQVFSISSILSFLVLFPNHDQPLIKFRYWLDDMILKKFALTSRPDIARGHPKNLLIKTANLLLVLLAHNPN